ncbi:TPA: hypothetical protein PTV74_001450 [Clostridium botulinum]|uniref:hypothetical protein n=1 Tax=Clostridium botulinum TaxID=1491 RepID=UPI000D0E2316|nr:hypothetical protein [Clostridium botulinum]PSM00325.1 hypothetical protein C6C12_11905 [Clostridium botulinum]HDK7138863.1 hypothetical protein [Clostridium botulinum]HDK7142192.1 hypothetical protein [Clostridium botulinum]HDK7144086.1 hypothetical protein [Clostridium botulinum]HDK7147738.1 hypothetical protein [Clostridium botulinum]
MYICDLNTINFLDKRMDDSGVDNIRSFFYQLAKENEKEALNLINDENLHFTSLFVLRPEIEELNLFQKLNARNRIALGITNEILSSKRNISDVEYLSFDYIQAVHSVLKWMIETGCINDGLDDQYDEILDITAIFLTKIYRDKTVLPIIAEMIFRRYKQGLLIHDLAWAFFESRDPISLSIISERLQSKELKYVELAQELLSFVPRIGIRSNIDIKKQHLSFLDWFGKNNLFLHFTGESFQQVKNPVIYRVVLEAKYLCEPVSINTGEILRILSGKECKMIDEFKRLDENAQELLSEFSVMLHHNNICKWQYWLECPIGEQIKFARIGGIQ